ncbi:MAG: PAP/fibrillin family protein [Synechococcaceae cyanobacterium]|nr:PAP/fibrillin family protein [Synechococcaceae cyanobacterium]
MTTRESLMALLRQPNVPTAEVTPWIARLEAEQPADLNRDAHLLAGVWELRWSSARQPWLVQTPWLENLQVLDPERRRGMNLLRLRGVLGPVAAVSVVARLEASGGQRLAVRFERGGWIGPRLAGLRPELLLPVRQPFPAWLDITVLDEELRICRGNAGTAFALLRRNDLDAAELLPPPADGAA